VIRERKYIRRELLVVEDALLAALYAHLVAGVEKGLGRGGGDWTAVSMAAVLVAAIGR
jgi:hypothetical protein